uniref:hypothetical protein n=1 Tax=Stenotrophomonas sp. SrG TaxID=3414430 RepID=UPI003CE93ADB
PVVEVGPSVYQQIMNPINPDTAEIPAYASTAQDAAEYVDQRTRGIRTLEQYAQALVQVQAVRHNVGMPQGIALTPLADN